jgi:hypothetical protein
VREPVAQNLAAARDGEADLIALAWARHLDQGHVHVVSEVLAPTAGPVLPVPSADRDTHLGVGLASNNQRLAATHQREPCSAAPLPTTAC